MNTSGMTKRAHKTLKILAKGNIPKSSGSYIWAYVDNDGLIWPKGRGKSWEYAMSLSERKYPDSYRLYKLVRARKEPNGK